MNTRQIVSGNLRKLLSEKGKRAELSRFCNVSDAAVAHWVRVEEPKIPTAENLDDIARFFQIEVSDLFSERPLNSTERRVLYILARLNGHHVIMAVNQDGLGFRINYLFGIYHWVAI